MISEVFVKYLLTANVVNRDIQALEYDYLL